MRRRVLEGPGCAQGSGGVSGGVGRVNSCTSRSSSTRADRASTSRRACASRRSISARSKCASCRSSMLAGRARGLPARAGPHVGDARWWTIVRGPQRRSGAWFGVARSRRPAPVPPWPRQTGNNLRICVKHVIRAVIKRAVNDQRAASSAKHVARTPRALPSATTSGATSGCSGHSRVLPLSLCAPVAEGRPRRPATPRPEPRRSESRDHETKADVLLTRWEPGVEAISGDPAVLSEPHRSGRL